MKTIKQIFDTIIGNNTMLPIDLSVEKFPFIDNYKENRTLIDTWFKRNFGDFYVYFEPENYTEWISMMNETLFINQPNIVHLWNLTLQEYSPIENVVEHSERTITDGERKDVDSIGERTDIDNVGTSGKTGNTQSDRILKISPYDVGNIEKDVNAEHTSVINNELETMTTKGAQTDNHTKGEQINKEVYDRHANVGVTSNVDLMRQENSFWSNEFMFYRSLFHIIKKDWMVGIL